jgi:hypothetical protein
MAGNDFLNKFEEVGIAWKNENSIGIIIKADIHEGDKLMMIENRRKEQPKHPDFNLFRERKVKIVTEE